MTPASPATILISPLGHVQRLIESSGARHLVSCMREGGLAEAPAEILPGRHLTLAMHDIEAPRAGFVAPSQEHVGALVAFVESWDRRAPMLIHCQAGISRSTAAAFIALCALNPTVEEARLAVALRAASARAWPNRLLVALADDHLGRDGRMQRAIEQIGPGEMAILNAPFAMPAFLD